MAETTLLPNSSQSQNQVQQQDQAPPSDRPAGFDEFASSLDPKPPGMDELAGNMLASDAQEHDKAYRSGQLALSPKEVLVNQLLAQQGKGNLERAIDKAYAAPRAAVNAAPGMWEGIKKAVSDEWTRAQESTKKPFLQNLKEGFQEPYNEAVAGGAATLKAIPGTIETAYDAARLNPAILPTQLVAEHLFPKATQNIEAAENAATSALTHYTNVPVDAAVKASGADTSTLGAKIHEFADPLIAMGAIPGGEAGALEKGIAETSTKLVRGVQKGAAYADKALAQSAPTAVGLAKSGAGAAMGSHFGPIFELIGAGAGLTKGNTALGDKAVQILTGLPREEVIANADTILKSGEAPWIGIQDAAKTKVQRLNGEIEHFRKGMNPQDLKDLDAVNPDGSFTVQTKNLSGDAKKIRVNQDEILNLQGKISDIAKRDKANQHFDDATRYLTGLGLNAGLGATIGGSFAGATTPPGDTSSMGEGVLLGGGLGLVGGIAGVPKGMQAERATQNAKLNEIGSKITPQVEGIAPEDQANVNKLAAVVAPHGFQVEVVDPTQYANRPEVIAAAKNPEAAGIIQAPNGHIDLANKRIVLNKDALPSGVGWHELTHFTQDLYGKMLRSERPDLMANFDKAYDEAAGQTGGLDKNLQAERDAEVGRILLNQTPIENFYGGKRIFDTLDPSNIVNAIKARFGRTRVDPTLQAPYSQADLNQMRQRMFRLGEQSSREATSAPPTQSAQNAPEAQVAQAPVSRPQIIPAQQQVQEISSIAHQKAIQEAIPFVETMGQSKENARAKVEAAVGDLINEGKPVTSENLVAYALRRAVPKPEEVVNEVDSLAKQSVEQNPVQHGEFGQEGYTAITPNEGEAPAPIQSPKSPAPQAGGAAVEHPDYHQVYEDAVAAKREELSGTRRKTKDAEIERAGIEAMMKAHAETADPNAITFRTNKFGRTSISGRELDPNDPAHAHLLEQANLSPEATKNLNDLETNMGKTVAVDYMHAPEEETASGVTRKGEQEESPAQARVSGEAATRRLTKSFVPTGFTYNAPSKTFEVNGFSPDKFLNNANTLIPWARNKGMDVWKDVNDPEFVSDFQKGSENNRNGYTLSGKPIEGTEATQVKPNPDFKPNVIPKDKADLLNAMMGDTSARNATRKQGGVAAAAKADKQSLAAQNSPYWEPQTGETNRVRAMLGDEAKLLESAYETLRPELIENVRTEPAKDEQTLRPSGFTGDRGAFAEKGLPKYSASGFMPRGFPHGEAIKDEATRLKENRWFMPSTTKDSSPLYSQLLRAIDAQPDKASPEQLRAAILKGPGIKQAELRETKDQLGTSFEQMLKDNPKATKQQMLDFVRENQVQVKEVNKGAPLGEGDYAKFIEEKFAEARRDPQNDEIDRSNLMTQLRTQYPEDEYDFNEGRDRGSETKFHQYQLPGGHDYGETLATLPNRETPEDTSGWTTEERTRNGQPEIRVLDKDGAVLSIRSGAKGLTPEQAIRDAADMRLGEREAKSQFTSSHWDEPNVVLHLRHNERMLPDGGKMLFLEELQSDWAQKGRREGYSDPSKQWKLVSSRDLRIINQFATEKQADAAAEEHWSKYKEPVRVSSEKDEGVPDLPFKSNWKQLGLKIALRKAIESGADHLGWTTGAQQAERYDLSKQVHAIKWDIHNRKDGAKLVTIVPNDGNDIEMRITADGTAGGVGGGRIGSEFDGKHIRDIVGKDVGDKIMTDERGNLSGSGLKVGGSGMTGFYDKELVNLANDLVKKWGVRVGESKIQTDAKGEIFQDASSHRWFIERDGKMDTDRTFKTQAEAEQAMNEGATVHSLPITEAMKRDILEKGQPMFMPATSTPKQFAGAAKELGLRYDGPSLGGAAHQFTDEKTGSSLDVPKDATPEMLKTLFQTSRDQFKDMPQFMPSSNPKAIESPAIRTKDGRIYKDAIHWGAYQQMLADHKKAGTYVPYRVGQDDVESGFVDRQGNFLSREEALQRAKEIKQVTRQSLEHAKEYIMAAPENSLEALTFAKARQFHLGGVVVPDRTLRRAKVA